MAQILKRNEFPLATRSTDLGEAPKPISFVFRDSRTEAQFPMETTDRAGIESQRMDLGLLTSLVEAEGWVLLLDWNRGDRETEILEALMAIHIKRSESGHAIGERDARPLAVCLSKVDQFIKSTSDLKRIQEKPEEFVQDRLSDELRRRIRQFHSNVKFFPVSAVGLRVRHGCIQKSVFYDERLLPRVTTQGTPLNIVEPFIWIFEQLRGTV